jgi:mannosylglycoprotein endo-beta-mannosidase
VKAWILIYSYSNSVQPVKIIDPHLVSTFFDGYKRVYLHTTTELENKSSSVVECDLNIQVTSELEGGVCIVEHLQTQQLSIPSGKRVQHTFPQVNYIICFCCSEQTALSLHF